MVWVCSSNRSDVVLFMSLKRISGIRLNVCWKSDGLDLYRSNENTTQTLRANSQLLAVCYTHLHCTRDGNHPNFSVAIIWDIFVPDYTFRFLLYLITDSAIRGLVVSD